MQPAEDSLAVDRHALVVAGLLEPLYAQFPGLQSAAEWLTAAASVAQIVADAPATANTGWCKAADEYDALAAERLGQLLQRTVRFQFTWSAIEAVGRSVLSRRQWARHEVRGLTYLLGRTWGDRPPISPHDEELASVLVLSRSQFLDDRSKRRLERCVSTLAASPPARVHRVGRGGLGLDVVRLVRNALIHGAFSPPTGDDDENSSHESAYALIESSSRVALLALQMILVVLRPGDEARIRAAHVVSERSRQRTLNFL